MLNEKDLKYIKWLSQRLVNKYGEDPQILVLVDEIIAKIIAEIQANKMYGKLIVKNIPGCIKTLQEVIDYNQKMPIFNQNQTSQILIDKNTNTFENMDLSEIFK